MSLVVDRNAAEVALREKLERFSVARSAELLGGLEEDGLAFYCPHCQVDSILGRGIEYPSARFVVEPLGTRADALSYACQKCEARGTRWTLVRTILDDPDLYAEMLRKAARR